MAEQAERPPDAGRGSEPCAVIDHDGVLGRQSQSAHLIGELLRRRQHMGQGTVLVADLVDIEELRAGNVGGDEVGLRITRIAGQVPRGVQHLHPVVAQMLVQPFGRDQGIVGHGYIQGGEGRPCSPRNAGLNILAW